MRNRLWMLAAVAAVLVVAKPASDVRAAAAKLPVLETETSNLIEVRKRGNRSFKHYRRGSHHAFRRGYHRRHVFRHRHRPRLRIYRGPRVVIYGGYNRCAWLRRRAVVTGSRYWWRRYRWCRGW